MISPLAYVNPDAKIGKDVTIHPFAYIDKNVEIGDNCTIMPYGNEQHGLPGSHYRGDPARFQVQGGRYPLKNRE